MSEIVLTSQIDLKQPWIDLINACSEITTDNQLIQAKATTRALAKQINKSMKSVQLYVKEMVNRGILTYNYRVGRNGGMELNFNGDYIKMIQPPTPEPNKPFIPKGVLNRQLNERFAKEGIHWDMFMQLPNPELSLWGFLIGRVYDVYYRMYRLQSFMDKGGDIGNHLNDKLHSIFPDDKIFGTSQLTCFEKLAEYCIRENYNPLWYLTAIFRNSTYIAKVTGKKWQAPRYNAFLSEANIKVFHRYAEIETQAYAKYAKDEIFHERNMNHDVQKNGIISLVDQMWDDKTHGRDITQIRDYFIKVPEVIDKKMSEDLRYIQLVLDKDEYGAYESGIIAYNKWKTSFDKDVENLKLTPEEKQMFIQEVAYSYVNQVSGSTFLPSQYVSKIGQRSWKEMLAPDTIMRYGNNPANIPIIYYYMENLDGFRSFTKGDDMSDIPSLINKLKKNISSWCFPEPIGEVYGLIGEVVGINHPSLEWTDSVIEKLSPETLKGFSKNHHQVVLNNIINQF